MCTRLSMNSYHHNPYRQSSASYTPQQVSYPQQGKLHAVIRASTQLTPAADPDDPLSRFSSQRCSESKKGTPANSLPIVRAVSVTGGTHASVLACTSTSVQSRPFSSVPRMAMAETTDTVSTHDSAACGDGRPIPLSSALDGGNSQPPSVTMPLHVVPLSRARHSGDAGGDDLSLAGNTVGSLPSESTPTRCSAAPMRSRQAQLNAQSLSSTVAVERQSFSDWIATAAWDDPSTGSCPSSSSWSLLNQPQPRNAARAMASSPISPVDSVATTLFIDGLPAFIENKWQLQPYVPPQGLVAVRVKSSRGRNVGFAVYDSIAAAREALSWFKHMIIIKETAQGTVSGVEPAAEPVEGIEESPVLGSGGDSAPSAGMANDFFPVSPVALEPTPLEYEEYLFAHSLPAQFAAVLRKCTLLRAEWARSLETQHPPSSVTAAVVVASSSAASSSLSHPPSPWGAAAAVVRPLQPPPVATAVPRTGREPSNDVGDNYSQVPEPTPQNRTLHVPLHHLPSPSACPKGLPSPQQPPCPCAAAGCTHPQATHPATHQSSVSLTRFHAPSPVTRRAWAFSAPSAPLQKLDRRCYYSCGAAKKADHQHAHSTTCQPSFPAHWGSYMTERSDVREQQVDGWRGAPAEQPALPRSQDEPRPQQHRASRHQCKHSSEPPLPSRTLFVRLIHNFDAPGYLQEDQVRSSTRHAGAVQMKPFTTVGLPQTFSRSVTALGITTMYVEDALPPTPTHLLSKTEPSLHVLPTKPAMLVSGATGTRSVFSVVPHHRDHVRYQSPSSPTLMTTPQMGNPLESQGIETYSSLQPSLFLQRAGPCGDREGGGAGAAEDVLSPTTPTAEDRELFRFAQSVLREEYFSEKFAGFLRYREFLRPPYYGGCFVLFERGEDMQRCLQWMRKDARLMKLFAVAPARNDSFGR
ncbi:hypothetical protein, conserved [Leishmania tarentolae]|uniref:Uncharacterized protein n=1 Tax=Leishmania tarentolae TaxID=5689 RepID=A0A640KBM9_LEITA|nr:hypothetical protein, conserved [Leishmania tarentolae]